MLLSIIVGTHNRADDLRETIRSLGGVNIPSGCACELLIVDNASQDHTPTVIRETRLTNMTVQALHEKKVGLSNARNLGISRANGEIILFTDDDLRYPADWLEAMSGPLIRREAHIVAGAMRLASHLERAWMGPMHRIWLAAPLEDSPASKGNLVGANMALRREVLSKVPRFDPELGPGALGFGDDSLFGQQLLEAGYQFATVPLRTEHHFLPERLTRSSFLSHAKKLGQSGAYTAHHWEHKEMRTARIHLIKKIMQLAVWRTAHRAETQQEEGMHPSEMHHLRSLHIYGNALIERRRPRNYERHGLVKNISTICSD